MPKIKINDQEYDFPQGMNLLDACQSVDIEIPHFCYPPLLGVVGSCRMCKVEVIQNERKRVDISCKVDIVEGLEIITESPAIVKQRQLTLEFLLANHPLDCPICDDAGECDLQDYYFKYGKYDSRMQEHKVRKIKAEDIGKNIVLDSERCVLCTRCVRFLEEVTDTRELGVFGMGSTEVLGLRPGIRLDNDYSGNVVDLCPVGALTDKDFRFKRRVWYLNETPSICEGCSRGCNVRIDWDLNLFRTHKKFQLMQNMRTQTTEHQRIQRIKPRINMDINEHWICDYGRYNYRATDADDRLLTSLVSDGGRLETVDNSTAVKALAKGLKSIISSNKSKLAVIISPKLTNEEIYATWVLFRQNLNLNNIDHAIPGNPDWQSDNILKTPDAFPNRTGCEWFHFYPYEGGVGVFNLAEAIDSGKISSLLCILADPTDFLSEAQLANLQNKYFMLRNLSDELRKHVDIALPAAAWGEYRGTFTNFQGRVQKLEKAFNPLGSAQPVWQLMTELSAQLKSPIKFDSVDDIFAELSNNYVHFKAMSFDAIDPVQPPVEAVNQVING